MKKYESKSRKAKTVTETAAPTRSAQVNETGLATLTPLEEKVIRMLHGLSEADGKQLEYAVGASEDSRQRLALMEAFNIAELGGAVPLEPNAVNSTASLDTLITRFSGRD